MLGGGRKITIVEDDGLPDDVMPDAGAWSKYQKESGGSRTGEGTLSNGKRGVSGQEDMGDASLRHYGGEEGGGEGGGAEGADGEPRPQKKGGRVQARDERLQAEYDNIQLRRPRNISAMAVNHLASSLLCIDVLAFDKKERGSMMERCACSNCGATSAENDATRPAFDVKVYTLGGVYDMPISRRLCHECFHVWSPDAAEAGCYAAQACESRGGSRWYSIDLLKGASSTLVFRGSSQGAVAEAFGSLDEPFVKAWIEYQRTAQPCLDLHRLGVTDIDKGPMCNCPVCANYKISLGPRPPPGDPYLSWWLDAQPRLKLSLSAMMDAAQTLDLKGGVGSASDHIPQELDSMYIIDAQQQQLAKDLLIRRASAENGSTSRDEGDEGDGGCAPGEIYMR